MEKRIEAAVEAPDFYLDWGEKVRPETVDRLFKAMTPFAQLEPESIGVALTANDETIPPELQGITLTLMRPKTRRRGDGCGIVPAVMVSLMNHHQAQDGPRPVTEAVADRIANFIETERSAIDTANPIENGYGERRKAFEAFLGRVASGAHKNQHTP